MILDYSYVSLHDVIYYRQKATNQWDEIEILFIMIMLCKTLVQLHQAGIVHRDIRPSTIFFSPMRIINYAQPDIYSTTKSINHQ
jgi:serine/threonine protein kinase